jgi:ABC-2 type transport system permease protein
MSKVIAIAIKDLKLHFSGKTQVLFFLFLPVIFTLLLSGLLFGNGSSKIVMVVVDEDDSDLSHQLVNMLQSSEIVTPTLQTRANAQVTFDKGDASAILIIPSGMEANLKGGQAVALDFTPDPANNNGQAAQQEVQKIIGQISRSLVVAGANTQKAEQTKPFTDAAQRQAYFNQSLITAQQDFANAPSRIIITQPENSAIMQTQKETQAAQASAGELIIWVFIPLLGTSEIMSYERVWGTLRRMVSTPTRKPTFLLGIISGRFCYGLGQMLILVLVGVLLLKVPWGQNPLALLVLLISFGLTAVAMGTMLGTFTRTPSQANGLSIALGMLMGLLGGCMLPLEMFPPAVANAAKILPTTWAMMGMTQLTVYNAGLIQILPYAAILLGFSLVFFVVGILRFRYE